MTKNQVFLYMREEEKDLIELEIPTFSGDDADQASAIETYQRDLILKSFTNRPQRELPPDFDGCCVECGEEIPKFRLEKLKSTLCVHCQELLEKKNKLNK